MEGVQHNTPSNTLLAQHSYQLGVSKQLFTQYWLHGNGLAFVQAAEREKLFILRNLLDLNWKPKDENVWTNCPARTTQGSTWYCFKTEQAGSCVQKKFWLQPLVSLILVLTN